ncbi:hypothetical protein [Rubinisphaera brasiliensis]|uniref:Uncharacterized protein n=1 Tax=Rubinisphaera brasiliensis (strain ATCC 49424 / DSM 5305 / JCM 21570 / IAM 15109 / NBRC 103401 / IFAM 1448) TaxID=756272 RepID=F0SPG8_RUBBR|nr:hypothetical protein [Rubinisphaera brasiliensis]ADY57872.1 hypothetical protein Plabr_0243 [Rubinisphaera brasiliensis DSM 5305]
MTKAETKAAATLLADRADRTETVKTDTSWAVTAYWRDGGQKLFYSLDAVREHVETH